MTDPGSLRDALLALKTASDIVKGFRSAGAAFEKAELKLKIADLADSLSDARLGIVDAQEEILELRSQVKRLEAAAVDRSQMTERNGVLYFKDGGKETGPYCPSCWGMHGVKMILGKTPLAARRAGEYRCPKCQVFL